MSRRNAPEPGRRVAVIGAGSWGTTFAKVLADAGNDVTLWARRAEVAREIEETKRNSRYLEGINLPRNLHATNVLAQAFNGADEVYFCVPSQVLRENLSAAARVMEPGTIAVSLMKGVEKQSGLRMSQVLLEELEIDPELVAVVSGPNLALEIARE